MMPLYKIINYQEITNTIETWSTERKTTTNSREDNFVSMSWNGLTVAKINTQSQTTETFRKYDKYTYHYMVPIIEAQSELINFLVQVHDSEFFYEGVQYNSQDYELIWDRITATYNQLYLDNLPTYTLLHVFFNQILNGYNTNYQPLTVDEEWSNDHIAYFETITKEAISRGVLNDKFVWDWISFQFSTATGFERSSEQCKTFYEYLSEPMYIDESD